MRDKLFKILKLLDNICKIRNILEKLEILI